MTHENLATRDAVNRPQHYTSHPSGIECIEISRHLSGCLAQAFQYVWRCGHKDDPVQCLKKAIYFIDTELSIDLCPYIYFLYVEHKLKKVVNAETSVHKANAYLQIVCAGNERGNYKISSLESAKKSINELIKSIAILDK
jgi:hypothetical protein